MSLPIGEVSRRSGLSADALRYYEREGLIPAPDRTLGGARRYEESTLDQLQVITALREVGFSLEQVRGMLAAKTETRTVRERIDAARAAIDRLEAALEEKERMLLEARARLTSWRAELDSGEPWPDTPLDCGPDAATDAKTDAKTDVESVVHSALTDRPG